MLYRGGAPRASRLPSRRDRSDASGGGRTARRFLERPCRPARALWRKPYGRALKVAFVYGDRTEGWAPNAAALVESAARFAVSSDEVDNGRDGAGSSLAILSQAEPHTGDPIGARRALVALQLELSAGWRRAGLSPDVVVGPGAGELAAAAVAGILTPDEALQLAAYHDARQRQPTASHGAATARVIAVSVHRRWETSFRDRAGRQPLAEVSRGASCMAAAAAAVADRNADVFLEVGFESVAEEDRKVLTRDQTSIAVVPALVATQEGGIDTLHAVAALYAAGADLQWERLASTRGQCVRVPTYPWQRQRMWVSRGKLSVEGSPALAGALDQPSEMPATTTLERRCRPDLTAPYVAPRTKLETDLVNAWTEALYMDGIGIHDNFFELGGHSLQATILLNHLQDRLGQAVPGHALFRVQCVHDLAEYLREQCPGAVRRLYPDELAGAADDDAFGDFAPIENGHPLAGSGNGNGGFSIPRLARDQEAEDLLARIDDLENDEVEALLGSSATNGEVRHE